VKLGFFFNQEKIKMGSSHQRIYFDKLSLPLTFLKERQMEWLLASSSSTMLQATRSELLMLYLHEK